jgi:hypothetical protein
MSDFCNSWGNFASVAGLLVSVLGFWFTIWGVLRAKRAAEQAADAARQAKAKILKQGSLLNFSAAISVMDEIIRLQRKKDWDSALGRHSELRRILVELKEGSDGLTTEQKTAIQGSVEQFKIIENQIERHFSSGKPEPDIAKINRIVGAQITKVQEIAITLKNN